MKRICFACLMAIVMVITAAHAQNFVVQDISEDGESAVLLDQDTGTEHMVFVGDEIEGWEITQIDATGISIMKAPGGDMPYGVVHKLEKMSTHGISFEP